MQRIAVIILGWFILSASAHAGAQAPEKDNDRLQHSWKQVEDTDEFKLVSTYPAPVPFAMHGEPEATLSMDAAKASPGADTLEKVVADEVADIRKQLQIADYEAEDGNKPVDGIATWYETIDGTPVAFIKYRAAGIIGQPAGQPLTAIHSILIKGGTVFFTHLIVRYAGHQDEVRHDQRFLIHSEIKVTARREANGQ